MSGYNLNGADAVPLPHPKYVKYKYIHIFYEICYNNMYLWEVIMIEPHFEYIDENLNKIIQNPDSVLYLRPDVVRKKQALFAMVKEEQGIYKNVQVTREQSKMTFPLEPIYYFYNGPGYLFLKKYIILHNWLALNTTNLDGFKFKRLDNFKGFVGIFATFNDGSATFVCSPDLFIWFR